LWTVTRDAAGHGEFGRATVSVTEMNRERLLQIRVADVALG
jgi:hypothetical protein